MVQTKSIITAIALIACSITASAQTIDSTSVGGQKFFLPQAGELEFFAGIDFNYRDILMSSQYEFLINLTPGMKWHMGRHTMLNVGALIPIINDYGDAYKRPRLDVLTVSHEMKLGRLALKPSIGLFTMERYGVDVKAMLPLTKWLALEGQAGYTGYMTMATGWEMSPPSRWLALGGFDVYFSKWNTQIRLIGGRFLKDDNGIYFEGMRHFTHTSVGVYLQYSDFNSTTGRQYSNYNGGFKVIISIPPYRRSHRHKVQFRPANNFRLTYNMNADPHSCKVYSTDSEQNERGGWFSPDILPWGANTIYDYVEK